MIVAYIITGVAFLMFVCYNILINTDLDTQRRVAESVDKDIAVFFIFIFSPIIILLNIFLLFVPIMTIIFGKIFDLCQFIIFICALPFVYGSIQLVHLLDKINDSVPFGRYYTTRINDSFYKFSKDGFENVDKTWHYNRESSVEVLSRRDRIRVLEECNITLTSKMELGLVFRDSCNKEGEYYLLINEDYKDFPKENIITEEEYLMNKVK